MAEASQVQVFTPQLLRVEQAALRDVLPFRRNDFEGFPVICDNGVRHNLQQTFNPALLQNVSFALAQRPHFEGDT